MKRLILMAASALLLMTQCRKGEVSPDANTLSMTVTVNPGRTDIAAGAIKWSKGDTLWVSGEVTDNATKEKTWKWLGSLEINQGAGENTAIFSGEVNAAGVTAGDDGKCNMKFFYLGQGYLYDATSYPDGNKMPELSKPTDAAEIDFSRQCAYGDDSGNIHNVGRHHVGLAEAKVSVSGNTVAFDVTLKSMMAMAHIKLTKDNAAYPGPLNIRGGGLFSRMKVEPNGDCIGVEGTDNKQIGLGFGPVDRYVMLVPNSSPVAIGFYGDKDGTDYLAGIPFGSGIAENTLYGAGEGQPITVNVDGAPNLDWVQFGDVEEGKEAIEFAPYNLGATLSDPYGDYYAWGELDTKASYGWNTYKWSDESGTVFSKYKSSGDVLDSEDDVAHVMSKGAFRMPKNGEFGPADGNCWAEGSDGVQYPESTLILLNAGFAVGVKIQYRGQGGYYWSSSLSDAFNAKYMVFQYPDVQPQSANYRRFGFCVRPVRKSEAH